MDENAQATTVAAETDDEWVIDISDTEAEDVTDDIANEVDEPTDDETAEEEAAPETDEADPAESEDGEADKDDTETESEKETDQFTLKYLGEEKSVSRDEVVTLAQKGMDYDRIRQKHEELNTEFAALKTDKAKTDETIDFLRDLAQEQGFSDVNSFINETRASLIAEKEGIDISVARKRIELDRKEKELAEKEARISAEKTEKESAEEAARKEQEKQQKDFLDFANEYKDIKPDDIPKEVWKIYSKGDCTLVQAYMKHENAQLKAQIAAEKKNAENKQRSTGSVTSAGKPTGKTDPFIEGWNSSD